jgi:hypothetical protein
LTASISFECGSLFVDKLAAIVYSRPQIRDFLPAD